MKHVIKKAHDDYVDNYILKDFDKSLKSFGDILKQDDCFN